jgi:hypothetical protein
MSRPGYLPAQYFQLLPQHHNVHFIARLGPPSSTVNSSARQTSRYTPTRSRAASWLGAEAQVNAAPRFRAPQAFAFAI